MRITITSRGPIFNLAKSYSYAKIEALQHFCAKLRESKLPRPMIPPIDRLYIEGHGETQVQDPRGFRGFRGFGNVEPMDLPLPGFRLTVPPEVIIGDFREPTESSDSTPAASKGAKEGHPEEEEEHHQVEDVIPEPLPVPDPDDEGVEDKEEEYRPDEEVLAVLEGFPSIPDIADLIPDLPNLPPPMQPSADPPPPPPSPGEVAPELPELPEIDEPLPVPREEIPMGFYIRGDPALNTPAEGGASPVGEGGINQPPPAAEGEGRIEEPHEVAGDIGGQMDEPPEEVQADVGDAAEPAASPTPAVAAAPAPVADPGASPADDPDPAADVEGQGGAGVVEDDMAKGQVEVIDLTKTQEVVVKKVKPFEVR